MKRYLKVYLLLLKISWSALTIYRQTFIYSIISSLLWSTLTMTSIFLLTSRTSSVFGWTRNELLLLTASYNVFFGIFYFLFQSNFRQFANLVDMGELDAFLIKPLDSQFIMSFWQASYTSLSRSILGLAVMVYLLGAMHIYLSIINILGFILLLFFGIVIMYTLWFSTITLTIWFTSLSNLRDLLYQINGITRYPGEMYQGGKQVLSFALFPLTLVVIVPVKTLLQKALLGDILWLVVLSVLMLFLSRKFWKFALRFYTSASG